VEKGRYGTAGTNQIALGEVAVASDTDDERRTCGRRPLGRPAACFDKIWRYVFFRER